jgi:hypothetical protein
MDLDLERATRKFESEHERRRKEAREKLDREKLLLEEKRKKDEAIEVAVRAMREERDRQRAERQRLEEELFAKTGGVQFLKSFIWIPRKVRLDLSTGMFRNDENETSMEIDGRGERMEEDENDDNQPGGDKICLPPSSLDELTRDPNVQYPLFFELTMKSNPSKITHAGVLEFIAEEGTVQIPKKAIRSLDLRNQMETEIQVRYVRLPKGSYAKLKVLPPSSSSSSSVPSSSASPLLDIEHQDELRSVLETVLRSEYATLTVGDVLPISLGNASSIEVEVLELQPEPAVNVLETELAVDLVYMTTIPNPDLPQPSKQSSSSSSSIPVTPTTVLPDAEGILPITFPPTEPTVTSTVIEGIVSKGESVYYKIKPPVPASFLPLFLSFTLDILSAEQSPTSSSSSSTSSSSSQDINDADLFISPHPTRKPSRINHVWSAQDGVGGTKSRVLSLKELHSQSDKLHYLSVVGYSGQKTHFRLTIAFKEDHPGSSTPSSSSALSSSGSEMVNCENCRQSIPKVNATTHLMYCLRNNSQCTWPGCGAVMRASDLRSNHWHCPSDFCTNKPPTNSPQEKEKHQAVYHSAYFCPSCNTSPETGFSSLKTILKHTHSECPERMIMCRFCGNYVRAGRPLELDADFVDREKGLTSHESKCGSRTVPCEVCNHSVVLKMMDHHLQTFHSSRISSTSSTVRNSSASPSTFTPQDHWNRFYATPNSIPSSSGGISLPSFSQPAPASTPVACPICSQSVSSQQKLEAHIDSVHLSPASVSTLTPTFTPALTSASITTNERKPEATTRHQVECPICTLPFPSERALGVHIDAEHS